MKILHVIDSGGLYGAEVMLLSLAAEQTAQGLEPIIASIGDPRSGEKPLETEAKRRGLRVVTFPMRPGPNIPGAIKVLQFARQEKCDILHSHGYKADILFGFIPKGLRKLPMVTTVHGWTSTGSLGKIGLYEWLDRWSLRFVDAVVLVNESMRSLLDLPKVHVVNNGIDLGTASYLHESSCDPRVVDFCREGYTLGAIGRLSPEKGFDILLDALAEVVNSHPDIRLVILGEGDDRPVLESRVRKLGLEGRVLMPGYVENARRYLSLFRIFILSSLTEGLPMVILEGMQAGVPILATRVGGVPGVLEDGKAGVLVEPHSSKALAAGLGRMIGDESLLARLTVQGKQVVSSNFTAAAMAAKYREIYEML